MPFKYHGFGPNFTHPKIEYRVSLLHLRFSITKVNTCKNATTFAGSQTCPERTLFDSFDPLPVTRDEQVTPVSILAGSGPRLGFFSNGIDTETRVSNDETSENLLSCTGHENVHRNPPKFDY